MKFFRTLCSIVLLAAAAAPANLCSAQAKAAATAGPPLSRFELYGGYAYFHPFASDINNHNYEDVTAGGLFSASYYFTHHLGVQVESEYSPNASDDTHCVITAQGGLVYRLQHGRVAPFAHVLGGLSRIGGPALQPCDYYGYGGTAGLGFDYILPVFHNHFAIRPIQGDFTYTHQDNGPINPPQLTRGGIGDITAVRLSAGITFRFGNMSQDGGGTNTTLTCSADPVNPAPGEPVTLSASVLDLKSYRSIAYVWSTTGGVVKGTEATETVDTTGLAPGNYDVTGRLVRTDKQRDLATCTTSFQIRSPLPPTVSCVADRAAINSGTNVLITTTASSPANRPLSYSYTTTNGQVMGNGATATLSTAGTTPGDITVTCKVTDDKGLSAQSTASVVIATPAPPPPAPQALSSAASDLCSISFERDRRRPDRVDNEAKACLDSLALLLNRDTTSHLALVGMHATRETNRNAAERVLNAADYLTKEKGIDPTRLELRTSDAPGRQVTSTLLPAGMTYSDAAAATIDPTKVKRSGQAYGIPGHHRTTTTRRRHHRRRGTVAVAPTAVQ